MFYIYDIRYNIMNHNLYSYLTEVMFIGLEF